MAKNTKKAKVNNWRLSFWRKIKKNGNLRRQNKILIEALNKACSSSSQDKIGLESEVNNRSQIIEKSNKFSLSQEHRNNENNLDNFECSFENIVHDPFCIKSHQQQESIILTLRTWAVEHQIKHSALRPLLL